MEPQEFKWTTYAFGVDITTEELDRPRPIRDPWCRAPLVKAGFLRPRFGRTLREEMQMAMHEAAKGARADLNEAIFGRPRP